jgi:hypothetical protein
LREALHHAQFNPETVAWLEATALAARTLAGEERERLDRFEASLPADTAWAEVPELDHDAHSLRDLAEVAQLLGALRR